MTQNQKSRHATPLIAMLVAVFCAIPAIASPKEIVVARDHSGNFETVQDAIDSLPDGGKEATVIRIKPGHYHGRIEVPSSKRNLRFIGDSATNTILEYALHAMMPGPDGKPIGTGKTAATTLSADDFTAENITFQNPATAAQAVAISIFGDRVAFRSCRFLGWQDTVYLHANRQYFTNCTIEGRVDFIFGGATAFFDNCEIHCRDHGYITAASTPQEQSNGFVFANCKITTAADTKIDHVYLGRPWRSFASVVFVNCEMPDAIAPEGWDNWRDPSREKTARFAEFKSTGPGGNAAKRVTWSSQLNEEQAKTFTRSSVLGDWKPSQNFQ